MQINRKKIIKKAKKIFLDATFIDLENREYSVVMHQDRFLTIFNLISDNGCIHISTEEDLADRMGELVTSDTTDVLDWLLLATTTFIFTAFNSTAEYEHWVDELATSYSVHTSNAHVDLNLLPNEHYEQLPVKSEYLSLLEDNPWFVFILTLQISYTDILAKSFAANIKPIVSKFPDAIESLGD